MDDLYTQLIANLERARQISELSDRIIEFARSSLSQLRNLGLKTQYGADAVQNQLQAFGRLKSSHAIKEIMPTVYGQQVVLFVSSFETHMKELVRFLGNNHIGLIRWPDGSSGKVDLAVLSTGGLTIGDLVLGILEQHGISFQDLQSTKKFFSNYLGIDITIDGSYEDNLILAAAIRHSFIHSGGAIDEKFLKQVRHLPSEIKKQYRAGTIIELNDEEVIGFRDSFINMADKIKSELNFKISGQL